jgi:hypothetical protein
VSATNKERRLVITCDGIGGLVVGVGGVEELVGEWVLLTAIMASSVHTIVCTF